MRGKFGNYPPIGSPTEYGLSRNIPSPSSGSLSSRSSSTSPSKIETDPELDKMVALTNVAITATYKGTEDHPNSFMLQFLKSHAIVVQVYILLTWALIENLKGYDRPLKCKCGFHEIKCPRDCGFLELMEIAKSTFEEGSQMLIDLAAPSGYSKQEFKTLDFVLEVADIINRYWIYGNSSVNGGEPFLKTLGDKYEAWYIEQHKVMIAYYQRQARRLKKKTTKEEMSKKDYDLLDDARKGQILCYQRMSSYYMKKGAATVHRVEYADNSPEELHDNVEYDDDMDSIMGSSPELLPTDYEPVSPTSRYKRFVASTRRQNEMIRGTEWLDLSVRYLKMSAMMEDPFLPALRFGFDEYVARAPKSASASASASALGRSGDVFSAFTNISSGSSSSSSSGGGTRIATDLTGGDALPFSQLQALDLEHRNFSSVSLVLETLTSNKAVMVGISQRAYKQASAEMSLAQVLEFQGAQEQYAQELRRDVDALMRTAQRYESAAPEEKSEAEVERMNKLQEFVGK